MENVFSRRTPSTYTCPREKREKNSGVCGEKTHFFAFSLRAERRESIPSSPGRSTSSLRVSEGKMPVDAVANEEKGKFFVCSLRKEPKKRGKATFVRCCGVEFVWLAASGDRRGGHLCRGRRKGRKMAIRRRKKRTKDKKAGKRVEKKKIRAEEIERFKKEDKKPTENDKTTVEKKTSRCRRLSLRRKRNRRLHAFKKYGKALLAQKKRKEEEQCAFPCEEEIQEKKTSVRVSERETRCRR